MQMLLRAARLTFGLLGLAGCASREVAPPAAPLREVPRGAEARRAPPEPGTTRVLIDAEGTRAKVLDIVDATDAHGTVHSQGRTGFAYVHSETSKPICLTPCVVDLTPGAHVLRIAEVGGSRQDDVDVQIGDSPAVIRHALGEGTKRHGSTGAGIAMILAGGITAVGGLAFTQVAGVEMATKGESDLLAPSLITLGAGAVLLLASIPVLLASRETHQRGSTTQFRWDAGGR